MAKNNRESKRLDVELRGNYRIWESEFPFAVITTVNISHTGICFKTDHEVMSGHSVELKIILNKETGPLSLLAKVIWSNPAVETGDFNTGVKIMNVNSDDAKEFKKFYKTQLMYPPEG
ncbi:MAG: PilZ domain-containing protein [Candidatus Omnitrophica bacterium]|nr:PilZ domain-containing protein [Candidatus Omnitrophota bacterium]